MGRLPKTRRVTCNGLVSCAPLENCVPLRGNIVHYTKVHYTHAHYALMHYLGQVAVPLLVEIVHVAPKRSGIP